MTAAGDPRADLRAKLLQAAETYAGFGWATTWCGESKNPKDSGKGWQKQYHPGHQPPTLAFAPDEGESQGEWEPQTPGSPNQFRPIGRNIAGIGIVCGWQSGGIIVVDIETADIWTRLRTLLKDKHAELWAKLATMPRTRTPKGGAHLFARVAAPSYCWGPRPPAALGKDAAIQWKMTGNAKLAKPADEPESEEAESAAPKKAKRTDLIELRGRSGFAVLPLTINTPPTVAEAADDDAREEACQPLIGSIESPGERFWVVEPKPVAELDPLSIEEFLELVKACQGFNQSEKLGKERKREVTRIAKAVTQVSRASDGDNLWARANGDSYWHGRMVDALIESGWRIVRELSDGVIEFAHSEASHEVSARFGRLRAPDGNPLFFAHTGPLPVETSLGATQVIMRLRHHGDGKAMFGEIREHYLRTASVEYHKARQAHFEAAPDEPAGAAQEAQPQADVDGGQPAAEQDAPANTTFDTSATESKTEGGRPPWASYNEEDPDQPGFSRLGVPFRYGQTGRRLVQLKLTGNAATDCRAIAQICRKADSFFSIDGEVNLITRENSGEISRSPTDGPFVRSIAEQHVQPVVLIVPKDKGQKPYWKEDHVPLNLATSLANCEAYWPKVAHVIRQPRLLDNGKVATKAGYDPELQVLLVNDHPGVEREPKADPKASDLLQAEITGLFRHWDWVDPNTGPAWTLAMLATLLVRHRAEVKNSPIFWISAEATRAGKSKLVDAIHAIATGTTADSLHNPETPRELQVNIVSRLMRGSTFIAIDNLPNDTTLASSLLDQISTANGPGFRIMHSHREAKPGPDGLVLCVNGNRINSSSDTNNRTLNISLGDIPLGERLPAHIKLGKHVPHIRARVINLLHSAWLQFEAEGMPEICGERHRCHEWSTIADFVAWTTGVDLLENRESKLIEIDNRVVIAGALAEAMLPIQIDLVHPKRADGTRVPNGWWQASHITRFAKPVDLRNDKDDPLLSKISSYQRNALAETLAKLFAASPLQSTAIRGGHGGLSVLGMFLGDVAKLTAEHGFSTPSGLKVRLISRKNPMGGAGKIWTFEVNSTNSGGSRYQASEESEGASSNRPFNLEGEGLQPHDQMVDGVASPSKQGISTVPLQPLQPNYNNNNIRIISSSNAYACDTHGPRHTHAFHAYINSFPQQAEGVAGDSANHLPEASCNTTPPTKGGCPPVRGVPEGLAVIGQPPPHPPNPSPPASQKPASGFPGNVIAAILEAVGGERTLPAARVDFIKSKAGTAKDFDKACLDVCTQHDLGNGVIVLRPKGEVA